MPSIPPIPLPLAEAAHALAACGYAAAQLGLLVHASHRIALLASARGGVPQLPAEPREWPTLTVQLPVYDEPAVVERLIDAAAGLDYPRDRLHIQVLDDSDDAATGGTSVLAAASVARHRARGVAIEHVRRGSRDGYKAGALAHGMARTGSEFLAVFDADFVPEPSFLRRLMPHFADARVGMVQARWGHLDREGSCLTRAQAAMLDAHFLLEHASRQRRGLFFNFNGTAGIWRRRCIEDAGGWAHDTLTEDLDLSYRAQLAGWRFVFDPRVIVPAELPADMRSFHVQQARWVTGALQTARKLLPRILTRPLPSAVQREAVLHLSGNAAYPLVLVLTLLLGPVLSAPNPLPPLAAGALQTAVILLGTLPVLLFLIAGQRAAGRAWPAAFLDSALALVLGLGSAPHHTRALWRGLTSRGGVFERTPKRGRSPCPPTAEPAGASGVHWGEAALAACVAALIGWAAAHGHLGALPFLGAMLLGLGWVALAPLAGRKKARRVSGGPQAARVREVSTAARSSSIACP